ncbi:lipase member H-B-like [Myzus persicae]|uniref:lipase member H-B-like n=1 Tax=Myzus persicae TaxID=13164 RepID=UPI000B9351C4|nr:lipase member H-B-like [Myzus persicae]
MNVITAATVLFLVFQLIHYAQFLIFRRKDDDTPNDLIYSSRRDIKQKLFVNGHDLDFLYWNYILGNDKPIEIEFGNESSVLDYWIDDLPLKVITHGWLASDDNCTGVFVIKTAYVDVGGYNVVTVDWSKIAEDIIYHKPAILTAPVGKVIAEFLDRMVAYTGTQASDIHLLGHSLGAHVMGSCGSNFKSGKIGRITGLDPASPGFENIPIQKERLSKDDAEFVDVIHTAGGTLGFMDSMGHVDFYPNGGVAPQPGYDLLLFKMVDAILGSHSRAYDLYADSVYNRESLVATRCNAWSAFMSNKCVNNSKTLMGHDATYSDLALGDFYLKTNLSSPFGFF